MLMDLDLSVTIEKILSQYVQAMVLGILTLLRLSAHSSIKVCYITYHLVFPNGAIMNTNFKIQHNNYYCNEGGYNKTDANGIIIITDSGGNNELLGKILYTIPKPFLLLSYYHAFSSSCQCYGCVHVPGSIEFHSDSLVCHSEKETM